MEKRNEERKKLTKDISWRINSKKSWFVGYNFSDCLASGENEFSKRRHVDFSPAEGFLWWMVTRCSCNLTFEIT